MTRWNAGGGASTVINTSSTSRQQPVRKMKWWEWLLRWWGAHRQHSCSTSTEVVGVDTAVVNKGLLTVVKRWKWSSGGGHNFVHRGPSCHTALDTEGTYG